MSYSYEIKKFDRVSEVFYQMPYSKKYGACPDMTTETASEFIWFIPIKLKPHLGLVTVTSTQQYILKLALTIRFLVLKCKTKMVLSNFRLWQDPV